MGFKETLGVCLAASACALALPGDENWSWRFFPNGPNEEVIAIETVGGDVYVGGDFTAVGPYQHAGLSRWNGSNWSSVGQGLQGRVVGIAVDARGYIFVAGSLLSGKPGTGRYGLAQWDGQTWTFPTQAMDRIASGPIAAVGNEVFLTFQDGGNELWRWTGTDLESMKSAPNGRINCLQSMASILYVGGAFSNIGGVASNHVAAWSAGRWASLNGGADVEAFCMAMRDGELLVGGQVMHGGVSASPAISGWDGQKWTPFATLPGNAGTITDMEAGGGFIYIGGNIDGNAHTFSRWNGSGWTAMGQDLLTYDVQAIGLSGNQVWVGGRFSEKRNPIAQYLAIWDGQTWSSGLPMESAKPAGRCHKLAAKDGKAFAMGTFATADKDSFSVLSQWTGSGWRNVGPKQAWSQVQDDFQAMALEVDAQGVIVYGQYRGAAGDLNGMHRWQGDGWSPLGKRGVNGPVHAIKSTPAGIFVGGNFTSIDGVEASNIALWNGFEWSALGKGTDKRVLALEWDGKILYVGGQFDYAGDRPRARVAQWQDGIWSDLGDPVSENFDGGQVNDIRMHGAEVLVAGTFKTIGKAAVYGVAAWKGGFWTPMGGGFDGGVNALAVTDHGIFAGGRFASTGNGTTVNSIARWTGSDWEPLGSGLTHRDGSSGEVTSMAALGEEFFVAGTYIDLAGGKPSINTAHWTHTPQPGSVRRRAALAKSSSRRSSLLPGGTYVLKPMIGPSGIYIRDFLGRRSALDRPMLP